MRTTKNTTKRVFIVFGTRPEAIKCAPIIRELRRTEGISVEVCTLRQHGAMLDQTMAAFGIRADHNFNVFLGDQGFFGAGKNPFTMAWRGIRAAWSLLRFFIMLRRERPDMLMVQGDTSTAFLAAFLAFHFKVHIAHIEAGLRTNNKHAPFPEEINRRLLCDLADLHFAPTEDARRNLLREGVLPEQIVVTGNTALDALRIMREGDTHGRASLERAARECHIPLNEKKLVLVTAHRRENFGEGLRSIAEALRELADRNDVEIVYPVHANPNVARAIMPILRGLPRVHLVAPLEYPLFVYLMDRAHLILTDSGGIQEEVSFLGKPTLVMRDVTERPEGVSAGTAKLVGTNKEAILHEARVLLDDPHAYAAMAQTHTAFGDGFASQKIVAAVKAYFAAH